MRNVIKLLLAKLTTPSLRGRVRGGSVLLFFLLATTTSAQHVNDIETQMGFAINNAIDHGVEVTKSLGQERDILKEGRPVKWRCDIFSFTLPKKRRSDLDEMIRTFEECSREDPNCYGINSMSESSNGDRVGNVRNLMIGDDPERYIAIGKDYTNFININILDAADSTKSHRYAYALEWKDDGKGQTDVRYIITYAHIPSATTLNGPYIDLGGSRIQSRRITSRLGNLRLGDGQIVGPNTLREKQLEYAIRKAFGKEAGEDPFTAFFKGSGQADALLADTTLWDEMAVDTCFTYESHTDTLSKDEQILNEVVRRLQNGRPVSADDLLCNDYILLIFSQLKQQYLAGQNTEFNAISIYTLCKRAREYGFFTGNKELEWSVEEARKELNQLKRDITTMLMRTTDEACRNYLRMAHDELDRIK